MVVTITKPPFAVPSPGTPAAAPGAQAIAASTATIADAPLSAAPTQPTVSATEGVFFSGPVGAFTDLNPSASIAEFRAIIDWGDGSPMTAGTIAAVTSGGSTVYQVSGSHTYADSIPLGKPGSGVPGPQNGTYPITVYVTDLGGAAVNLTNTASVADVALTLAGQLDPASDSGVSNTDAITNVTQPRFFGTTSEPDANVFLYATATGSSTRTLLGQTASDGNGAWSITSGTALADGSYTISAQAVDDTNHTLSNVTTVTQTLVIDTVGPKVTALFFDRINGQVQPTFQDFGGVANGGVGLNQLTLIDANNYRFRLLYSPFNPKHIPKFLVTSIDVNPGTSSGPQLVTVVINKGRYMRGGHFLFTARSVSPKNLTGIQDIAGNALDGEFYSFFPSGNNHVGGDFVAEVDSLHHRIYAPRTVIGPATPVSPPGTPGTDTFIPTFIPGKTPHAQAAARLSSRGSLAAAVHAAPLRAARLSTAGPFALLEAPRLRYRPLRPQSQQCGRHRLANRPREPAGGGTLRRRPAFLLDDPARLSLPKGRPRTTLRRRRFSDLRTLEPSALAVSVGRGLGRADVGIRGLYPIRVIGVRIGVIRCPFPADGEQQLEQKQGSREGDHLHPHGTPGGTA